MHAYHGSQFYLEAGLLGGHMWRLVIFETLNSLTKTLESIFVAAVHQVKGIDIQYIHVYIYNIHAA